MSLQRLFETLGPLSYFALICIFFLLFGLVIGWLLWWVRSKRYAKAESDFEIVKEEVRLLSIQNKNLSSRLDLSRDAVGTSQKAIDREAMNSVGLDGLTKISPAMAAQLDGMGLRSLADLDEMSVEERKKLDAKMASIGQHWDWNWLDDWKISAGAAAAGLGATTVMANRLGTSKANQEEVALIDRSKQPLDSKSMDTAPVSGDEDTPVPSQDSPSNDLASSSIPGVNLPEVEGPSVEWQRLDGIDPRVANQLQALGIRNLEQLDGLSLEDQEIIEAKLSFEGTKWDWAEMDRWRSASSTDACSDSISASSRCSSDSSQCLLGLPTVETPSVQWRAFDGIDPELADELLELGISNPDQLEKLSRDDSQKLEEHFANKAMAWDWNWTKCWKDQVAANPSSFLRDPSIPSKSSQDLVTSSSAAAHLASEGAKEATISQTAEWSFGARSLFGRRSRSNLCHSDGQDSKSHSDSKSSDSGAPQRVPQMSIHADAGHETAATPSPERSNDTRILEFSAGDEDLQNSPAPSVEPGSLPWFDLGVPRVKDDLTLLDGIDADQADALHRMGIHDFDHLHDLSVPDRDRLLSYFHHRGWELDMDQWRIASEGNTLDPTMEDIQQRAYNIYQYREQHGLGGWEKTDWDQAEWELRGNPIYGYGVPHHVDDFVETTKITCAAKEELYRMGLYNHGQIDSLDTDARRLLSRWFAGPRFGVDLTSAFNWLSTLKSVPELDYGETYVNRPDYVDDLSEINGIGPSTERELNRIGVYQYRQIATWDQSITQSVSQTLGLDDRIERDLWVVQAQRLSNKRV